MLTLIETAAYLRAAASIFTSEESAAIVSAIAFDPEAGDLIPGSGGYRKRRFGRTGMGKRGGARVIYLFRNSALPVFLITVYSKSDKGNLTKAEVQIMAKMADRIFDDYGDNNE